MTHKNRDDTVSYHQEQRKKERQSQKQIQEAKQIFLTYCNEKGLTTINKVSNDNGYLIWKALHDYAPSLWGRAKRTTQNLKSVDAISSKALEDLKHYFAQQLCDRDARGLSFADLFTYIETSVDNAVENFTSNKDAVISMLCLLSGDTFALLQKLVTTYSPEKLQALNDLQVQLYENVASQLGLKKDAPRHDIRNACFDLQAQHEKSALLSSVIEPVAFDARQEIEMSFRNYFDNVFYQMTRIDIRKSGLFGENYSIDDLASHLEDTPYKNDLKIAIEILELCPETDAAPNNEVNASAPPLLPVTKMPEEELVGIIVETFDVAANPIATENEEAAGEKAAKIVKFCIDQLILIPNEKGTADFYRLLTDIMQVIFRHYQHDPSFSNAIHEFRDEIQKEYNELLSGFKEKTATIQKDYPKPSDENPVVQKFYEKMLKAKLHHSNTSNEAERLEKKEIVNKKMDLLQPYFPDLTSDQHYRHGNQQTFYPSAFGMSVEVQEPSAPRTPGIG